MWWAMMALSLMAECNDVRLAEWPAHSLYFTGTKWIDLWVLPTWCSRSLGELQVCRHREGPDTWRGGGAPLEFARLAGRNLLRLLKNFICVRGWWKTVIWLVWILTPQPTVITGFFFCKILMIKKKLLKSCEARCEKQTARSYRVPLFTCGHCWAALTLVVMMMLSDRGSRWKLQKKKKKTGGGAADDPDCIP